MKLYEVRERIDAIDRLIVALLERRVELARKAGAVKLAEGTPLYDAEREKAVSRGAGREAELRGLPATDVEVVFRAVVDLCRRAQTGGEG
jgi:chorismate mutase